MSRTTKSILVFALLLVGAGGLLWTDATYAQTGAEEPTVYQCPMHPEVTSHEPGRCPRCNMFLKAVSGPGAASQPAASQPAAGKPAANKAQLNKPKTAAPSTAEVAETHTCPMHPHILGGEGDRCSVCGMSLVPRDELGAHAGHDHAHDTFVCPMHPQVVTDEAGRCPICGMDLVQKEAAPKASAAKKGERKIKHWVAPMDAKFISEEPGKSPMGMDLVPVYEDEGGRGVVKVDPVVVQNMGVRIARVSRQPIFRHIRALGTVDVAEDEIAVVNLRYSGWIEHLHVDETGAEVKAGQALAEVYSPELAAQEELLIALRTQGASSPLAQSASRRLSFFGMSDRDIARVAARKSALRTITVRSPRAGFVLHKNVVQGARVMAGKDLFRVGNLQKIWINAEVYEFDAPWVREGAPATMELPFQQGTVYSGKVSYVYPTLNPKSRTLRVRLEFENPGLSLKPNMFATVRIEARRKDGALAVPTEAILHSGERQLVFVALGFGRYDKREIVTGLSADRELTEVIAGLVEGERVVTSGQFLLDSESQLQEAVQKLLDARLHAKSPGAKAATGDAAQAGDAYWTCSMHPQVVQDGPGPCPICGMDLVEKSK